jgi:hypothetical protein
MIVICVAFYNVEIAMDKWVVCLPKYDPDIPEGAAKGGSKRRDVQLALRSPWGGVGGLCDPDMAVSRWARANFRPVLLNLQDGNHVRFSVPEETLVFVTIEERSPTRLCPL